MALSDEMPVAARTAAKKTMREIIPLKRYASPFRSVPAAFGPWYSARMKMAAVLLMAWVMGTPALAAELKPETLAAFDRYIRTTEARLERSAGADGGFLWTDEDAHRAKQVREGRVAIENRGGKGPIGVPGGLIHDWIGAVFIPGATLEKTLALVQDYDRNREHYQPEVMASKLVSRSGNDFKVYLRIMKKKVITVILDTDYDVRYFPMEGGRYRSRAYSTRIAEVQNAGKPDERTLPPGHDSGF